MRKHVQPYIAVGNEINTHAFFCLLQILYLVSKLGNINVLNILDILYLFLLMFRFSERIEYTLGL